MNKLVFYLFFIYLFTVGQKMLSPATTNTDNLDIIYTRIHQAHHITKKCYEKSALLNQALDAYIGIYYLCNNVNISEITRQEMYAAVEDFLTKLLTKKEKQLNLSAGSIMRSYYGYENLQAFTDFLKRRRFSDGMPLPAYVMHQKALNELTLLEKSKLQDCSWMERFFAAWKCVQKTQQEREAAMYIAVVLIIIWMYPQEAYNGSWLLMRAMVGCIIGHHILEIVYLYCPPEYS